MDANLRRSVIERARGRCEYCRFPESYAYLGFEIDHIIAEKHGGETIVENLAWSCYYYNSYKGPNIAGWIKETGEVVRLFNPRVDLWNAHFGWHGAAIVAKTTIGQATISVLQFNHPDALAVREWLLLAGENFSE